LARAPDLMLTVDAEERRMEAERVLSSSAPRHGVRVPQELQNRSGPSRERQPAKRRCERRPPRRDRQRIEQWQAARVARLARPLLAKAALRLQHIRRGDSPLGGPGERRRVAVLAFS
jgi:hypothetical protein